MAEEGLIIRKDGTLNKRESTINIGDPKSFKIVAFEKNSLYDKYHFITSYKISPDAFKKFIETGNIGISPQERKERINKLQKKQALQKREKTNASSFYKNLPKDARMRNQELRLVESIQNRLKQDPKSPLTEKEKNLLQRAQKYGKYKNKFDQKNLKTNSNKDDL